MMRPIDRRPKLAAIITEYRRRSHAEVIVTKLLDGYDLDGVTTRPSTDVASMYVDQFPPGDLSRPFGAFFDVPILSSIHSALTLDTDSLAVDGVIIVGEHGTYPVNERGQTLYPRRLFFEQVVQTFRDTGRSVPVFCDKHLSWNWDDARWMVDTAARMGFPFMAGSSLPLTQRRPPLELPHDTPISEAFVVFHGPVEGYGFHALETLQCMLERRAGGETGVTRVQALRGGAVWAAAREGRWDRALLDRALATADPPPVGVPDAVPEPTAFLVTYRDGTRATALLLPGCARSFSFAARIRGRHALVGSTFYLHNGEPFPHFGRLVHQIERFMTTGNVPYPIQRTLLTTGVLAAVMESRYRGDIVIETPELDVTYAVA